MSADALVVIALFGGTLAIEVGLWSIGYVLRQLGPRRKGGRQ